MRLLYLDSSALLALLRRTDSRHGDVREHFTRLRRRRHAMVTCEAVVVETATRLRYDVGLGAALDLRDRLARDPGGVLRVRESTPELRTAAFRVMETNPRLRLSYADAMGAAVARDENVDAVFALDEDFRALDFRVEPG